MTKKQDIKIWLDISHGLFSGLMPKDLEKELCAPPSVHAAMIDRQEAAVNDALVSMALASGETEVKQLFSKLQRETVIALCSRWLHYHSEWMNDPAPRLWIPPDGKGLWRAIFLAMTDDMEAASNACIRLWPEVFGVSRD